MITARTKRQLLIFVVLTLVGVTYVGMRYARLDRLFYDSTYEVSAQFGNDSGGVFEGSQVTYRGVAVGQVSDMVLTRDGVDVVLSIDREHDDIPSDTIAVVANRSAVGEQFLDLQPNTAKGPYLKDGSKIDPTDTRVPVPTAQFLGNTASTVESIDTKQLRTVISEMGTAFHGAGPDLAKIIDTANAFIKEAEKNFDVTTALIRDSNKVLRTQAAKGSAIRNFSRDLQAFSGTLAGHDKQLRSLIENGSATAVELRTFLEQNRVDLASLINNMVTTGEVVVKRLPGLKQLLVLYPWLVSAGFTGITQMNDGWEVRFGLVLTQESPACVRGYDPDEQRPPTDGSWKDMDVDARCAPSAEKPNWRGEHNAPRAPIGTYDASTGRFTWAGEAEESEQGEVVYDGGAAALAGEDSWKWLLLQPASGIQD